MRPRLTRTDDREARRPPSTARRTCVAAGALALVVAFAAGCPDRPRNERDGTSAETDAADVDAARDAVDTSDGGLDTDLAPKDGETSEAGDTGETSETGDATGPISCDHPEAPAGCEPRRPKGTPSEECPSGRYAGEARFAGKGICLPESPELPRLEDWSCPDDWQKLPAFDPDETEGDALAEIEAFTTCRPPDLPGNCSGGNAARLGETDCVQLGSSCPTGDQKWPSETDLRSAAPSSFSGEIVYVDAARSSGGDGSRTEPYAAIDTAVSNAASDDIVALSSGDHRANLELDQSVALVGACANQTSLRPPSSASSGDPVLKISGPAPAAVADLRIAAEAAPGIDVADGLQGTVTLRGLAVDGAYPLGLRVGESSTVEAEQIAIRRTASDDPNSEERGIRVANDAVLRLRDSTLRESGFTGLLASGAEQVALTDVAVVRSGGDQKRFNSGRGIVAEQGTNLEATRLLLEANRRAGFLARGTETTATLDLAAVADTRSSPSVKQGHGIELADGATLEASRLDVRRNHAAGLLAAGQNTNLTVERAVVAATQPQPFETATGGNGVKITQGAELTARSALFDRNNSRSVAVDGGEAQLTDIAVTRTSPPRDGALSMRGLHVGRGANLRGRRLYVADNPYYGVLVAGPNSTVDLTDTSILRTSAVEAQDLPTTAVGLSVSQKSSVSARRLELDANGQGFDIQGPETSVEFEDVTTSNSTVASSTNTTVGGTGGLVRGNVDFDGRRLASTQNPRSNLNLSGNPQLERDPQVDLRDLVLRGGDRSIPELSATFSGLQIYFASASVERALVEGVKGIGMQGRGGGSLDVTDVVVDSIRAPGDDIQYGYGFSLYGSEGDVFELTGTRVAVRDAVYAGVIARSRTSISLTDARITGTKSSDEEKFGDGIYVTGTSDRDNFTIERSLIRGNARAGLLASERSGGVADTLITGNRIGLVREGETAIEVADSLIRGNEVEDERCQRQCYEEPPEPSTVSP